MSNKSINPPLYDINGYTDLELYEILDLVNPTDRELEAKILMEIHKYEKIGTKSAKRLSAFFDDIYNHFFETEESDIEEGFDVNLIEGEDGKMSGEFTPGLLKEQNDNLEDYIDNVSKQYQLNEDENVGSIAGKKTMQETKEEEKERLELIGNVKNPMKNKVTPMQNMLEKGNPDDPQETTVGYTRDLEYSKGKLNPILQQTTKRIISIDSQYRSDKRTMPTEFTFNLSEPLKDVISLKLYSVQIPYTWYTIGKAYGNNFFYFKGRADGIDNVSGIHDIKVEIEPGNYSPTELIETVNESINNLKSTSTDVSMGVTQFTYNKNTSLTTSIIDIKKSYNESSYELLFENEAIPNYLGLNYITYSVGNIRSLYTNYNAGDTFTLTNTNNYLNVEVYQDDYLNVDSSFNILIPIGSYTRSNIITALDASIKSNDRFITSTIYGNSIQSEVCGKDAGGNKVSTTDLSFVDLNLKLSRSNILNNVGSNTKVKVSFYDIQSYSVTFNDSYFTVDDSSDIIGSIGTLLTKSFTVNAISVSQVPTNTVLCIIKPKFFNGSSLTNPNGVTITHEIKSRNTFYADYSTSEDLLNALLYAFQQYTDVNTNSKLFGSSSRVGENITINVNKDDRIWTNTNISLDSAFGFESREYKLNEIIGETPSSEQSGNYQISTSPFLELKPNIDAFSTVVNNNLQGINDIKIEVPNTDDNTSYSLLQYIEAINIGIRNFDSANNNILNSQSVGEYDNSTAFPLGTHSYLQNNRFSVYLDVNKVFDETNYEIDFNGSIFEKTNAVFTSKIYEFTDIHADIQINPTGLTNDSYENLTFSSTSGVGTNAEVNVVVSGGKITSSYITQDKRGSGYSVGDTLTIDGSNIGGISGLDATYVVSTVGLGGSLGVIRNRLLDLSRNVEHQATTTTASFNIKPSDIIFTIRPKNKNSPEVGSVNGNEYDSNIVLRLGNITNSERNQYVNENYPDAGDINNLDIGVIDINNNETLVFKQMDDIINYYVIPVLKLYTDPISNKNIFEDMGFNVLIPDATQFNIILTPNIKKQLVAKNYDIHYRDPNNSINTWESNLFLSELMTTNALDISFELPNTDQYKIIDSSNNIIDISNTNVDTSGNILDINGNILGSGGTVIDINGVNINVNGFIIALIDENGRVSNFGEFELPSLVPFNLLTGNNIITINAVEDGVFTKTESNNIKLTIPSGEYFRDTLITAINTEIENSLNNNSNVFGSFVQMIQINDEFRVKILMNVSREYVTTDFNLVFYDNLSFATCTSGASSVQNTTWDTTIGWIMGFREYTLYDLSVTDPAANIVDNVFGNQLTVKGDTGLSTNLYNYFLLCLDDYNQSHLNDGLVTVTNTDTSIPLPSYTNRSDFVCDPVTGQKVYSASSKLTQNRIYAIQSAEDSANNDVSVGTSVSSKSYGTGPFVTDVFGLIPIKVSGLENGSSYVEFGGTLQNQERSYFGPVNIQRMTVRLATDRGNLVDLNKANWSFSLICEQLNKLEPPSS